MWKLTLGYNSHLTSNVIGALLLLLLVWNGINNIYLYL
jgi:hypothetical protein